MAEAWSGVPVKLNKKSMLKSKISIGLLFEEGVSYYKPPLLIKYRGLGSSSECKYLVSVSKKRFPRAIDRNHTKRLMREAIRKGGIMDPWPQEIALIFVGKNKPQLKHILKPWLKFLAEWELETIERGPQAIANDESERPA